MTPTQFSRHCLEFLVLDMKQPAQVNITLVETMNWTISEFYRKKKNERLDSSSKDGQLFELQKFMGRHGKGK
jgi:hypothetical protein